MLVYFIRHGDPIYNPDCLTEKGKLQAQALAKRLVHDKIDHIYSSPKIRAQQTAEPTCKALQLQPQIEDWTIEIWQEFASLLEDGQIDFHMNQKLYDEIVEASDLFLAKLGYQREENQYKIIQPNYDNIAIFSHAGFGAVWLSHLLQLPLEVCFKQLYTTHTGVTIFEFQNKKNGYTYPRCLCLSDISHLHGDESILPQDYWKHYK